MILKRRYDVRETYTVTHRWSDRREAGAYENRHHLWVILELHMHSPKEYSVHTSESPSNDGLTRSRWMDVIVMDGW